MVLSFRKVDLNRLFPAYIETDEHGMILAHGPSLARHAGCVLVDKLFMDVFEVLRPVRVNDISMLLKDGTEIVAQLRENKKLQVRGVVLVRSGRHIFLTGHSPTLTEEEKPLKYRFTDFAPFDGAQDIFLAAEMRRGLLEDLRGLIERLKAEKLAAENANMAKSNFLACMSHEIRTPLNGVMGLAEVLGHTPLTEEQAEMVKIINESGQTLLALLNDILDLSKIDAGKLDVETISFELEDVVRSIRTVYALKAEESGVEFTVSVDPALAGRRFLGDPLRLRQILNNLCSNAVKFTAQGRIDVSVAFATDPDVLSFSVADTGIGISEEAAVRIFNSFEQAKSSTTREFGGAGLGLSICRRLCHLMGGEIGLTSKPGEGSTFRFEVPAVAAAEDIQARM